MTKVLYRLINACKYIYRRPDTDARPRSGDTHQEPHMQEGGGLHFGSLVSSGRHAPGGRLF
jgi:hypothetical protein